MGQAQAPSGGSLLPSIHQQSSGAAGGGVYGGVGRPSLGGYGESLGFPVGMPDEYAQKQQQQGGLDYSSFGQAGALPKTYQAGGTGGGGGGGGSNRAAGNRGGQKLYIAPLSKFR